MGRLKLLVFSLLPVVLLLIGCEVSYRIYYYQRYTDNSLALVHLFGRAAAMYNDWRYERAAHEARAEALRFPPDHFGRFFNDPAYHEERRAHEVRYEAVFLEFVEAVEDIEAKLFLLYIPSRPETLDTARAFFRRLAAAHDVPMIDATETLAEYDAALTHLIPEDDHLSRFGSWQVAKMVLTELESIADYRARHSFALRPAQLGDLQPNLDEVWNWRPTMPFHVATNANGTRDAHDITVPKSDSLQRVLFVGDSFTFGHFLNSHDSFPQVVERLGADIDAVNAGIVGYTICDEYAYLVERGQYTEPDVVVLQVLDNDLYGLYPHWQKQFCRGGKYCRSN